MFETRKFSWLALLIAALIVPYTVQAQNQLRVFFSDNPLGATDPLVPGPTPTNNLVPGRVLASPDSNNVTVSDGARVYIWASATGGTGTATWNGIAVDIAIAGPATILGGGWMQVGAASGIRWQAADFTQPTFNGVIVTSGTGIKQPPFDDGWNDGAAMLLGYLDFVANGGTSTVKFQVGGLGIVRQGGNIANDEIFFGFGDAALRGNQFGAVSTIADLTIVAVEACCLPGGSCVDISTTSCASRGGANQGPGTTCTSGTCPHPGVGKSPAITFQGQLKQDGLPLTGSADMIFTLWNDPTSTHPDDRVGEVLVYAAEDSGPPDPVGGPIDVANGLFTVPLEFGFSVFRGEARWLEVQVRSPSDPSDQGSFTTISPRQEITPVASAMFALDAPPGSTLDAPDRNPLDAVAVDNSGNVGIGTTSPLSGLHLFRNGSARIRVESATGQAGVSFLSNSTVENVLYSPNGSDDLRFFMGSADRLSITAAGNVGVGTNAPATQLHVFEDFGPATLRIESADNQAGLAFRSDAGAERLIYAPDASTDLRIRNGGVDRMTVTSDGKIGIGTVAPLARLDVQGGSLFTPALNVTGGQSSSVDIVAGSGHPSASNSLDGAAGDVTIRAGNGGTGCHPLGCQSGNVSHVGGDIILQPGLSGNGSSSGSVGISTVGPSSSFRLDVAGPVRCTALTETSSRVFKTNVRPLPDALTRVVELRGVAFEWDQEHGGNSDLGLIAEEVAEIFPELVSYEEDGTTVAGLKYGHLSAVLVESLKEQQALINRQAQQIENLHERIERLERGGSRKPATP